MTTELYDIKTTTFTEAMARLIDVFKRTNKGIGRVRGECHDGSRFDIRIASNDKPVLHEQHATSKKRAKKS